MSLKKFAVALALSAASFSAVADEMDSKDFYVQLNGGYAAGIKSNKEYGKTGNSAVFGFEGGARVNEHLRVGLGFDYLPGFSAQPDYADGVTNGSKTKVKTMAGFFNVFVDAGNFNNFKPYLVLGAGAAKNKTKNTTFTYDGEDYTVGGASKTNFAYKAGLGVSYAVTEDVDFDLRYQYVDYGKFKTASYDGDSAEGRLRANQFTLGVAYKF